MLYYLDYNFDIKEVEYVLQWNNPCFTEKDIKAKNHPIYLKDIDDPLVFDVDIFGSKERAVQIAKKVLPREIELLTKRLEILKSNLDKMEIKITIEEVMDAMVNRD